MKEPQNDSPKIYLLPNLMTAGNLFCGFAASLQILQGVLMQEQGNDPIRQFHQAIWLILAACIFDLLDGRLARLGGHESEFGREFDSLADVISFGVAPALIFISYLLYGFLRPFLSHRMRHEIEEAEEEEDADEPGPQPPQRVKTEIKTDH